MVKTSAETVEPTIETAGERLRRQVGRIVLVFQGGGALGAYQVGVYEALRESGVEPDWVIGTSIGAINAALIAGSKPAERLDRLVEFWRRVERGGLVPMFAGAFAARAFANNLATVASGLPGFFAPNPLAFLSPFLPQSSESAGYYSTAPLRRTLEALVDELMAPAGRRSFLSSPKKK